MVLSFLVSLGGTSPPGTGKSTLLTYVICRSLQLSIDRSEHRTILVCAPTNKAVSVLANRFLESTTSTGGCSAVLIGDQDKLLTQEEPALEAIFVYTWASAYVKKWSQLLGSVETGQLSSVSATMQAKALRTKLEVQLPGLSDRNGLRAAVEGLVAAVEHRASKQNFGTTTTTATATTTMQIKAKCTTQLDELKDNLAHIGDEAIVRELLYNAHVIFCTLASAGSTVMHGSAVVQDLIVDEAAAATEPELYIPFHFRPQRLLAVGDHSQLPATVMSRKAEKLGLSQSLHERLIQNCGYKHTMLNVQYRMRPEISMFPSMAFYGNAIRNGENVLDPTYRKCSEDIRPVAPFRFVQVSGSDTQGASGSFSNMIEARAVVDVIQSLQKREQPFNPASQWATITKLRVITFYQAQVNLLKRLLAQRGLHYVPVMTVDSSQGSEAETIVISCVRGGSGRVGFLSDDRRLNVAITRAKHELVMVGNANAIATLKERGKITNLAQNAIERHCVVDLTAYRVVGHRKGGNSKKESGTSRGAWRAPNGNQKTFAKPLHGPNGRRVGSNHRNHQNDGKRTEIRAATSAAAGLTRKRRDEPMPNDNTERQNAKKPKRAKKRRKKKSEHAKEVERS